MERKSRSLKSFVYHGLTKRILLATLVISAVLAAAVVFKERELVSEDVLEIARNRIQILLVRTRELLKESGTADPYEAFRESMGSLGDAHLELRMGSFVHTRFYDLEGAVFAESAAREHEALDAVEEFITTALQRFPGKGKSFHEVVRLGGRPHVYLVYPIVGMKENVVAYAQTVFAVSDEAITGMRRDLMENILWVIAIVFVTSAILYPVVISLTRRLATFSENLLESHLETVKILGSAIAKRDSDTSAHNFRVTIMAVRIAEVLGVKGKEMQRLIKGAFLHDVGKIGITDNILLKPARLDEAEFEIMKTHVNHGVDIVTRNEWLKKQLEEFQSHVDEGVHLLSHSSWLDEATAVVGGHHEKFDGSGYPGGLKGDEIPLVARIFAVADVFDALTCERPYKKPYSFERSMAILEEGRGSHFDPGVLDTFKALADSFYREIAGREDEGLMDDLAVIAQKYFHAGLESLSY